MNRREHLKLIAAAIGDLLLPSASYALDTAHKPASYPIDFTTRLSIYKEPPELTWLRLGDVMPDGWLKEQMRRDLETGMAGNLDKLCVEAAQDIFASGRNTPEHRHPIRGNLSADWWDGEAEGNWRTGYFMLAYLSGETAFQKQADQYVEHLLSYQDADGYIGPYSPTMKWQHPGEIWTQACILRGLLYYAELTRRTDVVKAAARVVDAMMTVYGPGKRELSYAETHDLMISDVLERLGELTGDPRYAAWSLWMYASAAKVWSRDLSEEELANFNSDNTLASLFAPSHPFYGHMVHIMEHIRIPLWLWRTTGSAAIHDIAEISLKKVDEHSFPGGSAVGMEWVLEKAPDPWLAEYEYCVTKETEQTFLSAMQKTGNAQYADRVERIVFNAAQGARTADGKAISYLTSDTRYACNARSSDGTEKDLRNKYSPAHADVAVCCSPMATNVAPLYVRGMWMRHRDGSFAAMLYGPSTLNTKWNDTAVTITQNTNFPFEKTVRMRIQVDKPAQFSLYLRDPEWSQGTEVQCAGAQIQRVGQYWKVTKRWAESDDLTIVFKPEIRALHAVNGEKALAYGPLVYAMPLQATSKTMKTYPLPGFEDTYLEMTDSRQKDFSFRKNIASPQKDFRFVEQPGDILHPFDTPLSKLVGPMLNPDGKVVEVDLVPLGNAYTLRRMTFPPGSTP